MRKRGVVPALGLPWIALYHEQIQIPQMLDEQIQAVVLRKGAPMNGAQLLLNGKGVSSKACRYGRREQP